MTKMHFEIMARIIRTNLIDSRLVLNASNREAELCRTRLIAEHMAEEFAEINPRFNPQTFFDACGLAL